MVELSWYFRKADGGEYSSKLRRAFEQKWSGVWEQALAESVGERILRG
jgi:hypothetical protein